jgi:hypothetical protein
MDHLTFSMEQILEGSPLQFSSTKLYEFATTLSKTDFGPISHSRLSDRLQALANDIPPQLFSLPDATSISKFWEDIDRKLNLIFVSFSPLCVQNLGLSGFQHLFETFLQSTLIPYESDFVRMTQLVIDAYGEWRLQGDLSGIRFAFEFAKVTGFFDAIFVPAFIETVSQYLYGVLEEPFNSSLSIYVHTALEVEQAELDRASPALTGSARCKLRDSLHTVIWRSKLDVMCDRGLRCLIDDHDTNTVELCTRLARETDTITRFTKELSFEFEACADACFRSSAPISEVRKLYRSLTDFSEYFSVPNAKILRGAFDKGLNTSPDVAARLLAEEIHSEFVDTRIVDPKTFEELIAIFRMLASKDAFEVYHHLLLSRRILMMKSHIVRADETFADALRTQCGDEYTKHFCMMFEDFHKSVDVLRTFLAEKSSPFPFGALILSHEAWPKMEMCRAAPPPPIDAVLGQFGEFYKTRVNNRKLQWSLDFTRVKLNVNGNGPLKEIKCNGLCAILLLVFNSAPVLSLDDLAIRTKMDPTVVEAIVGLLRSSKCGKLLSGLHHRYRLCLDVSVPDGVLSVPFRFPSLPKVDEAAKSTVQQSRNSQLESVIMMIMKKEKSMEKQTLRAKVKDFLTFRLEEELFENRLAHLAQNLYLKLDPSGRVHFLS